LEPPSNRKLARADGVVDPNGYADETRGRSVQCLDGGYGEHRLKHGPRPDRVKMGDYLMPPSAALLLGDTK
jgi:hypothetical protein